jgi:hypothetical protein
MVMAGRAWCAWLAIELALIIIYRSQFDSDTTCAKILSMELNDLLRCLVGLLAVISLGAVALVGYTLVRSFRRRARRTDEPPSAAPPIPAPPAAAAEVIPPASAARVLQPPTLPELISEAADTPRDERLIDAAASTLKTLPEGVRDAVWVAVVPHSMRRFGNLPRLGRAGK